MNKNRIEDLSEKQRKLIYYVSLVFFVVLMIIISIFVGKPLVKYAKEPEKFKLWLNSYGTFSRLVFLTIIVLQVVIAIIPGEPFELIAGYCFGVFEGTILTLIGITLGCLFIFVLVKKYNYSMLKVYFKDNDIKRLSFLKDPIKTKKLVFILNCLPGIPKDILSYFIGLTTIDIKSWLIIVFIGRIPSVISSTICGNFLVKKQYLNSGVSIGITIVLSIIGIAIYNAVLNKYNKKTK